MKTALLSVAMVMMCVTMAHSVKPLKDFNLEKFAGKWYRVGLAYDSPGFIPFRDKVKISMGVITTLPGGNANLTMWEALSMACIPKFYQYNKTSVPGHFIYFSTRHNMVKDVTVVDTNYSEYAVVLKYENFNREYTQAALYSRSPRTKVQVLQKFKAFALSRGFPRASILTPPPAGTFKFQKTELRHDGFNPTVVSDKLFFLDSSRGRYVQLDEELYRSIVSGKHKL